MPLPYILGVAGLALFDKMNKDITKNQWELHQGRAKKLEDDYKSSFDSFETKKNIMEFRLNELEYRKQYIKDTMEEFSEIFEKIKNKPEFRFENNDKFELTYSAKMIDFEQKNIDNPKIVSNVVGITVAGMFNSMGGAAISTLLPTLSIPTLVPVLPINPATFFIGSSIASMHSFGKAYDYGKEVDKVEIEVKKLIEEMEKNKEFISEISDIATKLESYLFSISLVYFDKICLLRTIVEDKKDYNNFSNQEKLVLENTVLLSGILFEALKIKLVVGKNQDKINNKEIDKFISSSENALKSNNIDV